jgi:hypothetical protein
MPPAASTAFDGLGSLTDDEAQCPPLAPVPAFDGLGSLTDDEAPPLSLGAAVPAADELGGSTGLQTTAGAGEQIPHDDVARPSTPRSQRRNAIAELLATLGTDVLPTAASRTVIDRLVAAGTLDALTATKPNFRTMLAELLDWDGARVTAALVRAAGAAVTGDGGAHYPQAVEALSFLAACAPMLEPDRLARLVDLAAETPCAYAPLSATLQVTERLERLLAPFGDARREALLASLWNVAHDGRWWDHTGVTPRRRRRRRDDPGVEVDGATSPAQALARLCAGELIYSQAALELLTRAAPNDSQRTALAKLAVDHRQDPDVAVMVAHVRGLTPAERPASPIATLVAQLEAAVCEDGVLNNSVYPDRPDEWAALYPEAPVTPFPIHPRVIAALEGARLPGGARLEPIRNAAELARNRDHMGNCTWSYRSSCTNGSMVICRSHHGGEDLNVSFQRTAGGWRLAEINSRFNGGMVPQVLRDAVARLGEALPPG